MGELKMVKTLIPYFEYEKIKKFGSGHWGDFESLLSTNEIDMKLKNENLVFEVIDPKIWIDNIDNAFFNLRNFGESKDSSDYVVLGIVGNISEHYSNKNEPPYCVLFDTQNNAPNFLNNIVFAPVHAEYVANFFLNNTMANLCYMGNFCNTKSYMQKTESPLTRAATIYQVLAKFDIKKASDVEQRLLLKLKNNVATLALNDIAQKRATICSSDLSALANYKMKRDIIEYYKNAKKMPLSDFLLYAEMQSAVLETRLIRIKKANKNKKDDDLQEQVKNYKL